MTMSAKTRVWMHHLNQTKCCPSLDACVDLYSITKNGNTEELLCYNMVPVDVSIVFTSQFYSSHV
jgi:hypothetical protein